MCDLNKSKASQKKLNSQHGSALITVLIVVSLLTILGMGLLMVSVSGLRRAMILSGANNAFYITDGAIEESLAEINDMAFEAEEHANDYINGSFNEDDINVLDPSFVESLSEDSFFANEVWQPFLLILKNQVQNDEMTNEDAMEYIDRALHLEFLTSYYGQFLDNTIGLEYTLVNEDNELLIDINQSDPYLEGCINFESKLENALKENYKIELQTVELNTLIDDISGYDKADDNLNLEVIKSSFTAENGLEITLKTDGRYNEHKKAIQLKVKVSEPGYHYVFQSSQVAESIHKNEITDYTLAAGKDLIVAEGQTTIDGQVYAYGSYPEKTNILDEYRQSEIGGVVVGYEDATSFTTSTKDFLKDDLSGFQFYSQLTDVKKAPSLTVTGDLYTRSNLKFYRSDAALTVTGDLGANELRVERSADENDDIDINVGNNLYLYEDIIIRGTGGSINLNLPNDNQNAGEMYLMLDTGSTEYNSGDLSASIIVQEEAADKFRLSVKNAYIYGVSFGGMSRIDDESGTDVRKYFMTGESLSTENKYLKFYQSSHASAYENGAYDNKLGNYNEVDYYYDFDENNQPIDENGDPTSSAYVYMESENGNDDLEFKKKAFLLGAKNGDPNSATVAVDTEDKEILTIRSATAASSFTSQNYSAGVMPGSTGDGRKGVFNPDTILNSGNLISKLKEVILSSPTQAELDSQSDPPRDVDKKMNYLATRDIKNEKNIVYDYVTPSSAQPLLVDNNAFSRLSQLINLDGPADIINTSRDAYIRIVNSNAQKDIYINAPGAIPATDIAIGSQAEMKYNLGGIIATKGDVYIYAPKNTNVTFDGHIYAEGRVIFYGEGTKTISKNEKLVNELIASFDELNEAFYADTGRKVENIHGYYDTTSSYVDQFDTGHGSAAKFFSVDYGNPPILAVVPEGKLIQVDVETLPSLEGMQKNKGLQRYEIEYWKEVRD